MANLTLSVDDKLLQDARIRAVKEGTSVNEICRRAIEDYVRADSGAQQAKRFDMLMARIAEDQKARGIGGGKPAWEGRDKLYERVLEERLPTLMGRKPAKGRR
ncbi:MAG: hypothetical protein HY854_01100 [Burkholderiales bacterium]|nr:hypothetical protein [Burkholderiales bacterium]